ncbi:CsbD family protein [Agromyces seonyuensis]|uniref:CsbD family protein n=1 Tax=Agromyces seonyuensis TaxID=2662446 RepID=A0A6I4NZM2_9MICO|nr:CsbD family protein [Agromyces seonyuensis]MWB99773.1 CsbD family protein [Agromyces seonyuensis]
MGLGDKISHTAEDLGGKAKEAAGKLTDNERLEREGQTQQAAAEAKKAGESAKDAAKDFFGNKE